MRDSYLDFEFSKEEEIEPKERSKYLKSAFNRIDKLANPILDGLENKFRELLSV